MPAARFKSTNWWKYQDIKNALAQELRFTLIGNVKGGRILIENKFADLPLYGFLKITVKFFRDSNQVCDIDNLLKMTLDLLQTARVINNDDKVREVHAYVDKSPNNKGRTEIEINLLNL